MYYILELRTIAEVETNLKAPKNRGNLHLIFRECDLWVIAGVALKPPDNVK
jgi:hypothetical protein